MADEDDVAQPFVLQDVDDVVDVQVETDIGTSEMTPLAESRERGREHGVAPLAQEWHDFLPHHAPCHAG